MTEKPIVAMRAKNYTWMELTQPPDSHLIRDEVRNNWRIEIRREGETDWVELEVLEVQGPPPDRQPRQ